MWLKQLIQESNQIGSCDIMGPTPGSRATVVSRVHPGLCRGEPSSLTVAMVKIPFSALSNGGEGRREGSREGKLERTIGQHDGCLLGEIFLSRIPKHCKRV